MSITSSSNLMRTTLTIDDDVLMAAKGLAARQRRSLGEVISDLSRQSLYSERKGAGDVRNGVPLLPRSALVSPVTLDLVNRLREELT